MDMTNFLKQSKLNNQNGKNHQASLNYSNQDLKKKASSLDSINAVERELDEVLKDLELNSQDLNDQLQENEYNQLCSNNNNNPIELPINIQKSMNNNKIDGSSSGSNSCSSPSNSINRNNNNSNMKWNTNDDKTKQKSILNSEFMTQGHESDLYIDDNLLVKQASNKYQMKSNEDLNKKLLMNNSINGVRKQRQNIISTYELCNECFDSSMLLSDGNSRQSPMVMNHHNKCCKNNNNKANCSDFTNFNNLNNKQLINGNNLYHHQSQNLNQSSSPIKFATSNQDLTQTNFNNSPFSYNGNNNNNDPYFHSRPRPPLAQINESIIPDSMSPKQLSLVRNNSTSIPIMTGSNLDLKPNGMTNNIVSQKVITIGIPKTTNGQYNKSTLSTDQSPSPKLTDSRSKSIPVPKMNGVSHPVIYSQQNGLKEEGKLDKLPPVPPSTWSTNPSIRRRNQQQAYATNGSGMNNGNRNNKPNGIKQITNQKNDSYEQLNSVQVNGNSNGDHSKEIDDNHAKLNELSIQESGSSSLEEEESQNSARNEATSQTNIVKNYDNYEINDNNKNDDEKAETTITRDPRFRDFGFSISDNPFGNGIFVNKIRNGSPAEVNSILTPFSQIYKVFLKF